jgi:hypothetical protein
MKTSDEMGKRVALWAYIARKQASAFSDHGRTDQLEDNLPIELSDVLDCGRPYSADHP